MQLFSWHNLFCFLFPKANIFLLFVRFQIANLTLSLKISSVYWNLNAKFTDWAQKIKCSYSVEQIMALWCSTNYLFYTVAQLLYSVSSFKSLHILQLYTYYQLCHDAKKYYVVWTNIMQDLVTPLLSLYKSLSTVEKSGNFWKTWLFICIFCIFRQNKIAHFPHKEYS